jgi:hypothetical protein
MFFQKLGKMLTRVTKETYKNSVVSQEPVLLSKVSRYFPESFQVNGKMVF